MLPVLDTLMTAYTIGFSLLSGIILLDTRAEISALEAVVYVLICILWPVLLAVLAMICALHLTALSFGAVMEMKESFR
jgi:biotin transporter BioY